MSQSLLHVARLALEFLFVNFFYFGRGLIGFDECDSCHGVLRALRISVRIIEHRVDDGRRLCLPEESQCF